MNHPPLIESSLFTFPGASTAPPPQPDNSKNYPKANTNNDLFNFSTTNNNNTISPPASSATVNDDSLNINGEIFFNHNSNANLHPDHLGTHTLFEDDANSNVSSSTSSLPHINSFPDLQTHTTTPDFPSPSKGVYSNTPSSSSDHHHPYHAGNYAYQYPGQQRPPTRHRHSSSLSLPIDQLNLLTLHPFSNNHLQSPNPASPDIYNNLLQQSQQHLQAVQQQQQQHNSHNYQSQQKQWHSYQHKQSHTQQSPQQHQQHQQQLSVQPQSTPTDNGQSATPNFNTSDGGYSNPSSTTNMNGTINPRQLLNESQMIPELDTTNGSESASSAATTIRHPDTPGSLIMDTDSMFMDSAGLQSPLLADSPNFAPDLIANNKYRHNGNISVPSHSAANINNERRARSGSANARNGYVLPSSVSSPSLSTLFKNSLSSQRGGASGNTAATSPSSVSRPRNRKSRSISVSSAFAAAAASSNKRDNPYLRHQRHHSYDYTINEHQQTEFDSLFNSHQQNPQPPQKSDFVMNDECFNAISYWLNNTAEVINKNDGSSNLVTPTVNHDGNSNGLIGTGGPDTQLEFELDTSFLDNLDKSAEILTNPTGAVTNSYFKRRNSIQVLSQPAGFSPQAPSQQSHHHHSQSSADFDIETSITTTSNTPNSAGQKRKRRKSYSYDMVAPATLRSNSSNTTATASSLSSANSTTSLSSLFNGGSSAATTRNNSTSTNGSGKMVLPGTCNKPQFGYESYHGTNDHGCEDTYQHATITPVLPTSTIKADYKAKNDEATISPSCSQPSSQPQDEDDGPKPFPCANCTKVFKRSEHLKRHIRSVHSNIRPFHCKYCDKKFSRSDNLAQHLKTHYKLDENGNTTIIYGNPNIHGRGGRRSSSQSSAKGRVGVPAGANVGCK